jgi:hypothetical protein
VNSIGPEAAAGRIGLLQRADGSRAAGGPFAFSGSTRENDEQAQRLVGAEAVLSAGGDEDRLSLRELDLLALDRQHSGALEDDVDLVLLVRLLAVGLGRDEDVDADLEPRRLVDDLVAAAAGGEAPPDLLDLEPVAGLQTAACLNPGMISCPYVSRVSSWPWVMR